jgi:hypothetical protein
MINKFGYDSDSDTETRLVWNGDSAFVFTTVANSADTLYMSSSAVADTVEVEVKYIDSLYVTYEDTITTAGRTQVAFVSKGTRIHRIYRAAVIGIGGDGSPATGAAGDLYVSSATATTDGVPDVLEFVKMKIDAGENQTLICAYTVPAGKIAVLVDWFFSTTVSTAAVVGRLKVAHADEIFHTHALVNIKSDYYQQTPGAPSTFLEKTEIIVQGTSSQNNTAISGGFALLLFDVPSATQATAAYQEKINH